MTREEWHEKHAEMRRVREKIPMSPEDWAVVRALEQELTDDAEGQVVAPGEHRVLLGATDTWSYGSQTQPKKYAEGSARVSVAATAEQLGLQVEVEWVPRDQDRWGKEHGTFKVWVSLADPRDVEIVKRRTILLREWVKRCWAFGVNPRVYNPFLPPGYEERMGLDYFGGGFRG